MASLPLILSLAEQLGDLSPSQAFYGPEFGLGIHPQRIRVPLDLATYLTDIQRQRNRSQRTEAVSNVGKDGFQVCMDVQQFKPSELTVKVVENSVIVEGKHEERQDEHGYISRHFVRRYALPKDYDADKLISTLSSDGVLTVSIPKPQKLEDKPKERVIQIQQTGPAHLNVKQNPEKTEESKPNQDEGANGDK